MKSGIAIKIKGGKAIMLGLFAVAVAIFFYALSTRYQLIITKTSALARIDSWTGQICYYMGDEFFGCSPLGD